jgi:hypothetical protein
MVRWCRARMRRSRENFFYFLLLLFWREEERNKKIRFNIYKMLQCHVKIHDTVAFYKKNYQNTDRLRALFLCFLATRPFIVAKNAL